MQVKIYNITYHGIGLSLKTYEEYEREKGLNRYPWHKAKKNISDKEGKMKTKGIFLKLSVVGLVMFSLISFWNPVQAQEIVWKFQTILGQGYHLTDVALWFAKEVEQQTGGKFKIQVFPGEALGFRGPRALTSVGQGLLDGQDMVGTYVSGDLKIAEIVSLHGLVPFDLPLRKAIREAIVPYQEKAMKERFNVQILTAVQLEPRSIYVRKPVKTAAELKGMKIRSEGINENAFTKLLGSVPVTMGFAEIYTSLQQGILDATWSPPASAYNARLYEVLKYCYDLSIGGSPVFYICNLDKFTKLPPDYQKLLKDLGRRAEGRLWDRVATDVKIFKKKLEEQGVIFNAASREDMKIISEGGPQIWDEWLKTAEPEAKEMMAKIKMMVAEWEKKSQK